MRFKFNTGQVPDVRRGRLRRSRSVLATPQGAEVVLFDTRAERYFTLNEVGRHVWTMLERPTTLAKLVESIHDEFEVPSDAEPDVVERDIAALLQELQRAGLLVADRASPG